MVTLCSNPFQFEVRNQSNDWKKAPLTYFGEAIDITHIEGRIEESCCRPRGGLDTCTNRRDALLSFVIKYEQKS